ncbi:MAG: hypothetical protein BWY09_02430 [Candidatus Hydrogenedentes bacterium ADurb.Bin179]|nr:MAG: hypothetical protein BWY09_02430 [Candidatus Hydrogenedentes bacterium ADurb.Bin179]
MGSVQGAEHPAQGIHARRIVDTQDDAGQVHRRRRVRGQGLRQQFGAQRLGSRAGVRNHKGQREFMPFAVRGNIHPACTYGGGSAFQDEGDAGRAPGRPRGQRQEQVVPGLQGQRPRQRFRQAQPSAAVHFEIPAFAGKHLLAPGLCRSEPILPLYPGARPGDKPFVHGQGRFVFVKP